MSLALQFAKPAPPDPEYKEAVRYDEEKQLTVYVKDGSPVCLDVDTVRKMGTTTSTAGSKTHFDD